MRSRPISRTSTRPPMFVSAKTSHRGLRCFSTISSVRQQSPNIRCGGATRRTASRFGIIVRPSTTRCTIIGPRSGKWNVLASKVMWRSSPAQQRLHATEWFNALRIVEEEEMSNKHWLASYGDRIPAEINADAYRSVLEMFEQAMQRFADKPAIRCFDQTLT